jgi:signal transduction histidine kinase
MKLLQKTNRSYLLFTVILLLVAGILLYFMITTIIQDEITEKLYVNKERITHQIREGRSIPQLLPVLEAERLSAPGKEALIVKDTMLYDAIEGEDEMFREVTSFESINGQPYRITLRQVILLPHDYYNSIGLTLAIVMALLLLGLFLISRAISRNLWQPFYQNLETLKNFSLQKDDAILLQPSAIAEFRELNEAIEKLTAKAHNDYSSLKEFTENASHEMQTPLAIIQAKLELLLQSDDISAEQADKINSARSSANRLSRLTQTLLLLTKIENRQFTETDNISLHESIEKQLTNFEDFIRAKNLIIKKEIQNDVKISANPLLMESLLRNLIGNAIRHNIQGGSIAITLKSKDLTISNTGKPFSGSTQKLFERFYKSDPSSESLGLGLAIIKRICEISGWQIAYETKGEWHILQVSF